MLLLENLRFHKPETIKDKAAKEDSELRKAKDAFHDSLDTHKVVILITDGEEHEGAESFPVQAAEKAAAEGIRIIAIGLGDENEGSRIPITGPNGEKTFLKYKGKEVWSKLGGDLLRNIVYVTEGGKYLSVGPGTTLDLGSPRRYRRYRLRFTKISSPQPQNANLNLRPC